jgi:prophage maintenance system killer protein
MTLLLLNGVALEATNKQLEDFAVEVATKGLSVEAIAAWLKEHSAKA